MFGPKQLAFGASDLLACVPVVVIVPVAMMAARVTLNCGSTGVREPGKG